GVLSVTACSEQLSFLATGLLSPLRRTQHDQNNQGRSSLRVRIYCSGNGAKRGSRVQTSSCSRNAKSCENACWHMESSGRLRSRGHYSKWGKGSRSKCHHTGAGGLSLVEDFVS